MDHRRSLFLCCSLTALIAATCLTDAAPWPKTLPMTREEVAWLRSYRLLLPAAEGDAPPTVEEILSHCTYEGPERAGGAVAQLYSSDTLAGYLSDCRELTEISLLCGTVYLSYSNSFGDTVALAYTPDGQTRQSLYRQATDTFYSLTPESGLRYTHFRYGV